MNRNGAVTPEGRRGGRRAPAARRRQKATMTESASTRRNSQEDVMQVGAPADRRSEERATIDSVPSAPARVSSQGDAKIARVTAGSPPALFANCKFLLVDYAFPLYPRPQNVSKAAVGAVATCSAVQFSICDRSSGSTSLPSRSSPPKGKTARIREVAPGTVGGVGVGTREDRATRSGRV